jgi:PAS domain S-box-containing protein
MEAPKHIPVSQKVPELTTQTATNTSSLRKAPGGRPLPLRIVMRPYRWFQENTFAPNFLTGRVAHPALGYLVALVFQLVMSIAILALMHFYPTFRFPSVPLILVILLVALGWGAGPSIVALLIGAVLLIFFVLPPVFSLSIAQSEDSIGIGLYLAVGLTISIFASNNERGRRTSEQLRLRLDTIIDAIPDSLTIYDAEGRRIQQNRVAREIGPQANPPLTLGQIVSQLATRRASGDLLPLEELPLARALRGEVVVGAELLYRVPVKQQDRLVAISAAPLYSPSGKTIEGAVAITHDLSERKQIEDNLRASEERYRSIVQTANEGVWLFDTEARTLYANQRMAEMLGMSAEEMIGHSLLEFVFPEDEAEGQVRIENNLRGRFEQFDFRLRRQNGTPVHTLVCSSPIRNGAGNIVGALGMFTDVTERRRTEEQEHILVEVSKVLTSTLDYHETLTNIAHLIVPQLADWFAVDLVNADGKFELIEIDHKDPEQVNWARALREQNPIDPDAPTGAPRVVRTGQSELYAEITDEMLVAAAKNEEELALNRQIGMTSLMLVPLVARGKTIGVVTFVSTESGRKYDRRDLALAEEVGRRAGVAIDNARLYQEAQKARDQLNIILQGVADGIVVWDREDHVIYENEAAARLRGYAPATTAMETPRPGVLGRFEFIDEQRRPIPHSLLPHRRVFAGEAEAQATIGYRDALSPDQPERWAILQARPVFDEQSEVVNAIAILHDITESKAEEEARQLLAAIVVSSHDAIIGKTIDGIVTSWNAAAEKMYGYSSEEIVGQPIALLFPPDHLEELATIMEKIKKGESVGPYDTTRLRKDGSVVNVSVTVSPVKDAGGEIVGASAIARDISEQKRLEADLWRSKQQLEVIFANIADGISVQDGNGKLIFMNEAGAKRSGYLSAEEALGRADGSTLRTHTEQRFEILDEHGNPLPYEELPGKRALRGEKAPQAVVQYYDKVTQTRQWSLVKARPLIDARGRVELAITIFSDMTETYEEKQRKDEFISMASHELKTPVTSLKGFAQVLQRRLQKQGDEQGLHYIARMDAQLSRLTKLVSDLLDVSKMQAGKLTFDIEPLELDALVLETVENVQAATSTHQISIEGSTNGCIAGDKDRLGQVFINLLTNAVKYSPQADKVVVHLSQEKQQAIVSVQDFGIGIDVSHHQKIFERFYQVTDPEERTYPGLGMGLYISSEIVQRHHGRMWVESRKGEGSTFSVALPLIEKD